MVERGDIDGGGPPIGGLVFIIETGRRGSSRGGIGGGERSKCPTLSDALPLELSDGGE